MWKKMETKTLVVGLDDTDSRTRGMCTTYLATVVAEEIDGFATVEGRYLTRLNPNIPYKTRGNACLSLRVETDQPERVRETVLESVEEEAVFDDDDTNPGVAFLELNVDDGIPEGLREYTLETVRKVRRLEEAVETAEEFSVETHGWKNRRGVIGAVAAVGAPGLLDDPGTDHTYELIAYRNRGRWDEKRQVGYDSFFVADSETYPETWDTVDTNVDGVVAVPKTDGPVVYGLRGSFGGVWRANSYVETGDVDHLSVFKTNQGTDMHLTEARASETQDMRSYVVEGEVICEPVTVEGGHVFFTVEDDVPLTSAAFEPTKSFRDKIRDLREGDEVTVCGGVKDGVLNVEKLGVRSLNDTRLVNPTCDCGDGKRMKSAGRNQGYRCRDCGATAEEKIEVEVERLLEEGWHEVPPSARRHISKPLVRGGFEEPHPSR